MSEAPFVDAPARAWLAMAPRSREALERWLAAIPEVQPVREPEGLDVVLADLGGLREHHDTLVALRQRQHPLVVPVILHLPADQGLEVIEEFTALVDDFVRVPVSPVELRVRIRSALRIRWASLQHQRHTQFEHRVAGIVGHDMRSPLSVLRMIGTLLADQDHALPLPLASLAPKLDRAVDALTRLAEDLVVMARGRAGGHLAIERAPCRVATLAADAIALVPRAERITIEARGDTQAEVDASRIRQLLVNLLQNALRHGDPDGSIHVRIDGRDPQQIELSVDNPGQLDPSSLASLFDAFVQGETPSADQGVGLGLFVVRMLVNAHGGQVTAHCTNRRVVFRAILPRTASVSVSASASPSP